MSHAQEEQQGGIIIHPVIIEDYNEDWPKRFNEIKSILHQPLEGLILSIEHVGSTSVPGLAAKPIIDIDIVVESMTLLPDVILRLDRLGYYHEGNRGIENREAFGRRDDNVPYHINTIEKFNHHLYVCSKDSEALMNHLTFRDTLRHRPDLVVQYGALKRELAEKYRNDRKAYTEGKTEFVHRVVCDR
ncbi:GrpB family protein [Paenibacillus sp. EC2-1]|uniref:GrpB family protein n=1 Tax=Paenibacillus sp. EC2-1 TaxID=3388665 RepID=UPI003BEEC557